MADDRATVPEQRALVGDEPEVEPGVVDEAAIGSELPRTAPTTAAVPSETVGTGSYVAVSCVAAMVLLLLVLIAGLLLSRWLG